ALLAPSSQNLARDTALFAELLSIPCQAGSSALSISPQRRKELLLEQLVGQIAGLAAQKPVLIVLEDAHWVDPTTHELFDILREENGSYVLAESLPPLAVPTTLQASLVARLDRLAPLRAVVQAGAAFGREFAYTQIRAVCNLGDAELEPLLRQLVASELVQQRGVAPHAVYTFKHALVQDAAYGTMLKSQRVQIHARIVE